MKRILALSLLPAILASGCARKAERFALKEGTPAFDLAKEFAAVMPALAPDKVTIIAKTKGFELTAAEVIQAIRDNMGVRTAQFKGLDAGQLKNLIEQGAEQLARRRLVLAAAAKAKTVVTPEEFEGAIKAQYDRSGGEEAFLEVLKSADVTIDHVKKSFRETLLINKYLAFVADSVKVPEADIRKVYEEERAVDKTASVRHVLLLTQGQTEAGKAAVRKRMEDILARAKGGEDIAALARQYSEDPGSKDNGGLYEDFGRGQMVKPFEDAAFSVPVGELSGVVETAFGFHILKVVDRKKETRPYKSVRPEIESRLRAQKKETAAEDHVRELKEKAKFQVVPL